MGLTERTIVEVKDKYGDHCLKDSVFNVDESKRGPQGFVEIYDVTDDGNKLIGKHNLVVYHGREMIAQKIFNLPNPNVVTEMNEYICWFGVGKGGVTAGDPFNPNPPIATDGDLYDSVPISGTDSTCADYRTDAFYKAPIDDVEHQQDPDNSDSWIIIRTVTTLGLDRSTDEQISEAGLFTALDNSPGYNGPFHLFSRVTFPTIVKTITRELMFVWYLYT